MLGNVQPGNLIYRMVVTHTDNGLVILEQIIPWVPSQANLCNSFTANYALCLTQAVLPRETFNVIKYQFLFSFVQSLLLNIRYDTIISKTTWVTLVNIFHIYN